MSVARRARTELGPQVDRARLHIEVGLVLSEHPVVHPGNPVLEDVVLGVGPVHAVGEHEPLRDRVRKMVEHVRRTARAGLLVLVGGRDVHGHVDAVHVVDERPRLEPVAVRVVETVDQRVLEQGTPPLGLVLRALGAGLLERVQAAERATADVVGDPDRARPQQREAVVGDATRIDDVTIEVADQARRR